MQEAPRELRQGLRTYVRTYATHSLDRQESDAIKLEGGRGDELFIRQSALIIFSFLLCPPRSVNLLFLPPAPRVTMYVQ